MAAAWWRYHEELLRGVKPLYQSRVTQEKLSEQLKAELKRLQEAKTNSPVQLDNGKLVWTKPSRNDCCMFGD